MEGSAIFSLLMCLVLFSYAGAFYAGVFFENVGKSNLPVGSISPHDLWFWIFCVGSLLGFFIFYMLGFAALNKLASSYVENSNFLGSTIMIFELFAMIFLSAITSIFIGSTGRQYYLKTKEIEKVE